MCPLPKRCSLLLATFCLLPSAFLVAGDRIPFSMHDAESQVSQGPRDAVPFSINALDEPLPTTAVDIAFSIHDAKPLEQTAKPDCAPARQVNRMLVIAPSVTTLRVRVCDERGCRYELRNVPHPILGELKKLAPKWSYGDKECDHFRLIDTLDPKNQDLLRELQVKPDELPLLIKETDVEKRKKAAGMSGDDMAKLWNKWFVEPQTEEASGGHQPASQTKDHREADASRSPEKCLPSFGSDSHQWTYPGDIRSHLTDPRQVHHLPKAVVDSWTDQQCVNWHNWHHEVLSGRRVGRVIETHHNANGGSRYARPTLRTHGTKTSSRSSASYSSPIENRIATIARATIRLPPARMVAAANASYGNSSDAKKAKKKRSENSRNGNLTSANVFAARSLVRSSPSNRSVCLIRLPCCRSSV